MEGYEKFYWNGDESKEKRRFVIKKDYEIDTIT